MHPTYHSRHNRPDTVCRLGFTLIELIVSLAVISVATTIFLKLYMASTDLGSTAQHRELAASIAESQLTLLVSEPSSFQWDMAAAGEQGLFRVRQTPNDPVAGVKGALPDVLLPHDASFRNETVLHEKFRWSAYGRLPSPSSAFVEVTVDVHWDSRGESRHVALSSVVPRTKVDPDWTEK